MALVQRLDIRQGQALVMTPQLQQAIKLLQLSNIELAAYVENEIEQNPLLEREETPREEPARDEKSRENSEAEGEAPVAADTSHEEAVEAWHEVAGSDGEGNLDYAGDPDAWRSRNGAGDSDDLPGIDQTVARPVTLREHLLAQLAEEIKDPAD